MALAPPLVVAPVRQENIIHAAAIFWKPNRIKGFTSLQFLLMHPEWQPEASLTDEQLLRKVEFKCDC